MKKSTAVIIVTGLVSLALAIIFGVISLILLAGALKKDTGKIDISKYTTEVQEWVDDTFGGLTSSK